MEFDDELIREAFNLCGLIENLPAYEEEPIPCILENVFLTLK